MFTGIVDHTGRLREIAEGARSCVLHIESSFSDLALGESIAVDGTCLTVTKFSPKEFSVDVSPETLRLTSLGNLKPGSRINLERALRLSDRLGGHIVTGHVDQTGELLNSRHDGEYLAMTFSGAKPENFQFLVKKGSVAINGVSLTLNAVNREEKTFEVMLIPHTLERTNLSDLKPGMAVNLEFDWMTKIILSATQDRLDKKELK